MKRLHELTAAELQAWRQERMRIGQQTYGDRDTGRYNLVDVVEELLDVLNILERFENRAKVQGNNLSEAIRFQTENLKKRTHFSILTVMEIDSDLNDHICTDENGGERIWWPSSQAEATEVASGRVYASSPDEAAETIRDKHPECHGKLTVRYISAEGGGWYEYHYGIGCDAKHEQLPDAPTPDRRSCRCTDGQLEAEQSLSELRKLRPVGFDE